MTSAEQTLYVQFSESNAWEGETWHRYIPVAGNEQAIERLRQIISASAPKDFEEDEDAEGEDGFSLSAETLTEAQVDTLVEYANDDNTSYSNAHAKLDGTLDLDGSLNVGAIITMHDLYKLEIQNRMRSPEKPSVPEG